MLKKINLMIAKFGIWIFLCAAAYKFTFWIIDMVRGFKLSGGWGVYYLFQGLFEMLFYLAILAVILEVSRKIAEKYTAAELASPQPQPIAYQNNYPQQAPVQPQQAPVQQAAPAPQVAPASQAAPTSGVWYCASCGTQNTSDAAFCAKCGKPK